MTPAIPALMDALAQQNVAMRATLDVIRENEFLRESLAAKGVVVGSPTMTMIGVAELVAARHSVTVSELRGPCRARYVAWPRQEAMWIIRQITMANGAPKYSLPQIGTFFGGRDHTTALHAVRAHQARSLTKQEAA